MDVVSEATFEMGQGTQVLYFGASWCGSCPAVQAQIEEIESSYPEVRFGKVDVEKSGVMAESMKVMGLPTVIVFVNGKEDSRFTGSTAGKNLVSWLTHNRVG